MVEDAEHILRLVKELNEDVRKHGDALALGEARAVVQHLRHIEAWCKGMRELLEV